MSRLVKGNLPSNLGLYVVTGWKFNDIEESLLAMSYYSSNVSYV